MIRIWAAKNDAVPAEISPITFDSEPVLAQTEKLLNAARSAGVQVIYVTVGFRAGYPEVHPNNGLFSWMKANSVLPAGSDGTKTHPEVAPLDSETVIIKHRISAFTGTELDMVLRSNRIETLLLAGVTSGVTLSTVRQAFDLADRLAVVEDCCADTDPKHTKR